MDGWETTFILGQKAYFQRRTVSFRFSKLPTTTGWKDFWAINRKMKGPSCISTNDLTWRQFEATWSTTCRHQSGWWLSPPKKLFWNVEGPQLNVGRLLGLRVGLRWNLSCSSLLISTTAVITSGAVLTFEGCEGKLANLFRVFPLLSLK